MKNGYLIFAYLQPGKNGLKAMSGTQLETTQSTLYGEKAGVHIVKMAPQKKRAKGHTRIDKKAAAFAILLATATLLLGLINKSEEKEATIHRLIAETHWTRERVVASMEDMTEDEIVRAARREEEEQVYLERLRRQKADEEAEAERNRRKQEALRRQEEEKKAEREAQRAERDARYEAMKEEYRVAVDAKLPRSESEPETGSDITLDADEIWAVLTAPNPALEKENAEIEAKIARIEEERQRRSADSGQQEQTVTYTASAQTANPIHPVVDGSGFNEIRVGEQYRGDVYYQTDNRGSRMEGFDEFYYVNEH